MPMLMPIYALILLMFFPSEPINLSAGNSLYLMPLQNKIVLLLYYLIFTVLIPGIIYILLKNFKLIKSLEMDEQNERKVPMVIMIIACYLLFHLFTSTNFHLPKYIYGLCLSGSIIISAFVFINLYFKISLHATGVGIFTGFIISYFLEQLYFEIWILAFAFIVSGLILTTRLFLEKHTINEVVTGYFTSLFITFVINFYYPFV